MITVDLIKSMFLNPIKSGADKLYIVSGYATPNMASWLFKYTSSLHPIDVKLIFGRAYEGISTPVHKGFIELSKDPFSKSYRSFSCQYIYQNSPINGNLYLWFKGTDPFLAFTGSANFIQKSFSKSQREIMVECDPQEASDYFDKIEGDSIYCYSSEVEEYIPILSFHNMLDQANTPNSLEGNTVNLSLLNSKTGETHTSSGLNWGHRKNYYRKKDGTISERYRNPNEAYIPLPKHIAQSDFFPLGKQHFTVVTDDRKQLTLRVEQQGDKAITTPKSNAMLGEYFRNRLGMPNGAFISKADLERYGRTDVTFIKVDDEQYFMNFAPGDLILGDQNG